MKKISKDSIINTVWKLLFIVIILGAVIICDRLDSVRCIASLVEEQDYYVNFLWPRYYGYISAFLGVTIFIAALFYVECIMDVELKLDSREKLIIKNVTLTAICVVSTIYILINILFLKSFNVLMIILAVAIVFAIFCMAVNHREYKKQEHEETNLAMLWDLANFRVNVILVAVVCCAALCFAPLPKAVAEAKEQYEDINNERINYCFGHIQGFEVNRATVKLEFVNMYGTSGRDYDMELLEQEYTNYKTGKGSWSNLWLFCQDSLDIQLKSQILMGGFSNYPYFEDYWNMAEYYVTDSDRVENFEKLYDRLNDMEYFAACVEAELNINGLTLREINDSYEFMEDGSYVDMEYETATPEQVVEACRSFAAKQEPLDGSQPMIDEVDVIDLSIDVGIGDKISDVSIVEGNGCVVDKVTWLDMELAGQGKYAVMSNDERVQDGKTYKLYVYVDVPLTKYISEDIVPTVEGVDAEEIAIDWEYEEKANQFKVDIKFVAAVSNQVDYKSFGIRLDYFTYDEQLTDCKIEGNENSYIIDEISWQTFDAQTGAVEDYSEATFSVDNKCYIANIKLIPSGGASFDDVEYLYYQDGVMIYEYDESQTKEPGVGVYPTAYFKRATEDGQECMWICLPYYQVYTTGVDGDVVNHFGDNNYVYVMEGGSVKFKDKPKLDYDLTKYQVTDLEGNAIAVPKARLDDENIKMQAQPIVITGYFEER